MPLRKRRKKTRTKKKIRKKQRRRTRKRGGCFGNCFRKKSKYTLDEINKMVIKAEEHDKHVKNYKDILKSKNIKTNLELMKYLEKNNKIDDILYAANAMYELNKPAPIRFGSPNLFGRSSPPLLTTGMPKN